MQEIIFSQYFFGQASGHLLKKTPTKNLGRSRIDIIAPNEIRQIDPFDFESIAQAATR